MMMLYLFLSLFVSQLLLVTPCVIEKEQEENREEPPSLEVNETISESPDPNTTEAPWTNVEFPLVEVEHDVETCRKVGMYISFPELGLSNDIILPDGFNAYRCKGKCSSTQQKRFPNRSALMALLKKKKGVEIDNEPCCVPTKLAPISVIVYEKSGRIVLRKFDDMVVEECGCK